MSYQVNDHTMRYKTHTLYCCLCVCAVDKPVMPVESVSKKRTASNNVKKRVKIQTYLARMIPIPQKKHTLLKLPTLTLQTMPWWTVKTMRKLRNCVVKIRGSQSEKNMAVLFINYIA